MSEKTSKVAICEYCGGFVKACHIDYLKQTNSEKEFTRLSNEGFIVKLETPEETRKREFRPGELYEQCKEKKCIPPKFVKCPECESDGIYESAHSYECLMCGCVWDIEPEEEDEDDF